MIKNNKDKGFDKICECILDKKEFIFDEIQRAYKFIKFDF